MAEAAASTAAAAVYTLPPYAPRCALTAEPIDVAAVLEEVGDDAAGAVASFIGTTRCHHGGRRVTKLEYEAHPTMAVATMAAICGEAQAAAGGRLARAVVVHRTGDVPVRHASIVIAVSSPHRADALAAVAFIIDAVKARVPVWKKEWYADGEGVWKENCECAWRSGGGGSGGGGSGGGAPGAEAAGVVHAVAHDHT